MNFEKSPAKQLKNEIEELTDDQHSDLYYTIGKYAITFNPHDIYQYSDNPQRLKKFYDSVNELFMDALNSYNIEYVIYVELSEPKEVRYNSIGSRLHCHGTITFKNNQNILDFLLYTQYKLSRYGQSLYKKISTEDDWYNYCAKQKTIINLPPLMNSSAALLAKKLDEKHEAQKAIDQIFSPSGANRNKAKKPLVRGSFSPL